MGLLFLSHYPRRLIMRVCGKLSLKFDAELGEPLDPSRASWSQGWVFQKPILNVRKCLSYLKFVRFAGTQKFWLIPIFVMMVILAGWWCYRKAAVAPFIYTIF